MAPEQWRGEQATPAADVYALGGLLFTLLTGKTPYPVATLTELAYSVALAPPPSPSDDGADPRFDNVVSIAMAKDPAARFPCAAGFSAALRDACEGVPIVRPAIAAEGQETQARALRTSRRKLLRSRALFATAGATAAVVVSAVAWANLASNDAKPIDLVVCAETATMRDHPGSVKVVGALVRDQRVREVREERDGAWVHVRSEDGREGWALSQWVRLGC